MRARFNAGQRASGAMLVMLICLIGPWPTGVDARIAAPALSGILSGPDDVAPLLLRAAVVPPPRAKPDYKPPIEVAGARLTASLGTGGEPLLAGIRWLVEPKDGGAAITVEKALALIELAPGDYEAKATFESLNGSAEFTVPDEGIADVRVAIAAGRLEVSAKPTATTMPLRQATWRLWPAGKTDGDPIITRTGGEWDTIIAAGDYIVEVEAGSISARRDVMVTQGGTARADLTLEVGTILADAIAAEGTEPLSRTIFLLHREGEDETPPLLRSSGKRAIFSVGPGSYRLTSRYGLAEVEELVRVSANELTRVRLTLDAGRLDVTVLGPTSGAGAQGDARVRVYPAAGGNSVTPLLEVTGDTPQLRLPAGRYLVEARRDGAVLHEEVVIAPGAVVARSMVLNSGSAVPRLVGEITGGTRPDIRFTATPVARSGDPVDPLELGSLIDAPFKLPAGIYDIEAVLLPGGATHSQTAAIAAGEETELRIGFRTGLVRVELLDKEGGTAVAGARWRLKDQGTGHTAQLLGGTTEASLPPGRYEVVAESGERSASGSIRVVAGATQDLSLVVAE